MKRTLFLIYGGKSQEHDISLLTASNIMKVLDLDAFQVKPIYIQKDGTWVQGPDLSTGEHSVEDLKFEKEGRKVLPDVLKVEGAIAFPVLHGPNGEDGTIQGLFEMLDIPYVGMGVLASACGMDKLISKKIFELAGLPQVPYVEVLKKKWLEDSKALLNTCQESLSFPVFVKPANMGSSVGISKAENLAQLEEAITFAFRYDRRVVVEQGVVARELEVAILGNDHAKASVVGEVVKAVDFYDFDEKYKNGNVNLQIPADVPEAISQEMRSYALKAFEALDGSGLTRCDFFLTADNQIFINEVNTLPGFTAFSMYPLLWEATGLSYGDLIKELLKLAQERYDEKKAYQTVG